MDTDSSSPTEWAQHALASFEHVIQKTPGFRLRAGQHAMAACVAETLAGADLGEHPDPSRAIAVIQAGTGVGKSAAYASTAIAMALQRQTRVLISTATVALQEQLLHKDLPALAASLEQPFSFALAKGRARYVCQVKLERLVGQVEPDELFDDDLPDGPASGTDAASDPAADEARRMHWYAYLSQQLATRQWDGDRDTLHDTARADDWHRIAAERHTCTVRQCPRFRDCSYYQARTRLSEANVIVANHDLLLASLGMKTLPDLDNCLIVLDEAHHLPAVALDQFASALDLSNLRWLDKLPKIMQEVAGKLHLPIDTNTHDLCSELKTALTDMARLGMDMVHATSQQQDGVLRFANGQLPDTLFAPIGRIAQFAESLLKALEALGKEVKQIAKDDPSMALRCAQLYAKLGALAPKLASAVTTTTLLLEHDKQPLAKWLQVQTANGYINTSIHACPIVPGDLLRQFVWSQVRGAVLTSASLTSCGSFDFFLREVGLAQSPHVQTLEVESPFDYPRQGTLTVAHTRNDPKQAEAYTGEMVQLLLTDLAQVQRGALVLFTSKAQMRQAVDALPAALRDSVLVQGTQSRTQLLQSHMARIEAGLPSILFGMQSFGEGLDLPGALCETVFITKLPFASPADPVAEARAEWLRSLGRDPFNELVIPATGIRLLQWTGRAIRSEDDQARIICYDKRLQQQAYGRRMLVGLPPYRVEQRDSGG